MPLFLPLLLLGLGASAASGAAERGREDRNRRERREGINELLSGASDLDRGGLIQRIAAGEAQGFESPLLNDLLDEAQAIGGENRGERRDIRAENREIQQAATAAQEGAELGLGNIRPQDYTPNSVADALDFFNQTGDQAGAFRKLKPMDDDAAVTGIPGAPVFGSVPSGMVRIFDEQGIPKDVPVPGGAEYNRRMDKVRVTVDGIDVLDKMLLEIKQTGGDTFGASSKRQSVLYNQTLSLLGQLANAGVMQPGEVARFAEGIVDPTEFQSRFRTNDTLAAPYIELRDQMMRKQTQAMRAVAGEAAVLSPQLPNQPPPPPAGTVPVIPGS